MAIRFTMAKRGVLPEEKQVEEGVVRGLQPRLEQRQTVDVVRFQDERHWGSVLRGGDLAHALSAIRDIMMHEMREGNAITLPGIGTFRLSLKGQVEVRDGTVVSELNTADYGIQSPQKAVRLPSGNTLVNDWWSEWGKEPLDTLNAPPQAIEIDREGKVVWQLRAWRDPDLGPSTTIQPLSQAVCRDQLFFGDFNRKAE